MKDLQIQIQTMTKKIEHEKINLRIMKERLTQKQTYDLERCFPRFGE